MNEYANYGFHLLLEKLEEDKYFFTNNTSFLSLFIPLFKDINRKRENNFEEEVDDDEPDSLD